MLTSTGSDNTLNSSDNIRLPPKYAILLPIVYGLSGTVAAAYVTAAYWDNTPVHASDFLVDIAGPICTLGMASTTIFLVYKSLQEYGFLNSAVVAPAEHAPNIEGFDP